MGTDPGMAGGLVSRLLEWGDGLAVLLICGAIRHGCAVSMVPIASSRAAERDLLTEVRLSAQARSGVRAVELFLKQQAPGVP